MEKYLETDPWAQLLRWSKVVRDPVHEDIRLTQLETDLVDTSVFQRLRHLRQLGPAYLLYPSANHTRFEHSLGALFCAQFIIDAVQRNYENQKSIVKGLESKLMTNKLSLFPLDSRDIVLTRTAALLHDGAHIPFGHILEKEGSIVRNTQWADPKRCTYFFEECGVKQLIVEHLKSTVGTDETEKFADELRLVLGAIEGVDPQTHQPVYDEPEIPEDKAVGRLPHPYVGDIVGNTICADLTDYLLRDSYFTGLKLSNELRLLNNFVLIGETKDQSRLTLLLVRKGRKRDDALSGAVEFLRQRYYLAERVYYHRVKTAASAMIIAALQAYLKSVPGGYEGNYKDLMKLGEDELLYKLAQDQSTGGSVEADYERRVVSNVISKFHERQLYKPVYMVYNRLEGPEAIRIKELIEEYSEPEARYKFQRYVEELFVLPPGSIVLYVSKKDPGKIARTRCLWIDGQRRTLDDIAKEITLLSQDLDVVKKRHGELWRLYVFMDRALIARYGEFVSGFCKARLLEINDVEEEVFSKARPLEDYDVYRLLHVKQEEAVSNRQMELFVKSVKNLRARESTFSKMGIPVEDLAREFEKTRKLGSTSGGNAQSRHGSQ